MTISRNISCRICGSRNLEKFLDLGEQPLANRFLKREELMQPEPHYPLEVYFCKDCFLTQLVDIVDKKILFGEYIYFSSGMPKLSDHFRQYAEDIMNRFLKENDFVVEIASNDGILLKFFKDSGYKSLGIDPAVNIVKVAKSLGVETIIGFFSDNLAGGIAAERGQAKVILANNVVAHINDHHDLVKGITTLLSDDGVFVFEAPYLVDMFENLTYDTIYHEHLSYLTITPLIKLFEKYDLEIFDMELHQVQGQSIRVFVGKRGRHYKEPAVSEFLRKERNMKLDNVESYHELARRIAESKIKLVSFLREFKNKGKRIAAYGAPAKGNTLLNYCKIGPDILEFALEDLPSKQRLYTPGMKIPVVSRSCAESNLPDYYLLLAWNYLNPILAKEEAFRSRGGKFIIPVGDEIKII
jgi:hypothetical protein